MEPDGKAIVITLSDAINQCEAGSRHRTSTVNLKTGGLLAVSEVHKSNRSRCWDGSSDGMACFSLPSHSTRRSITVRYCH